MPSENYEEGSRKIIFNMPSSGNRSDNASREEIELKDRLMKLIIDTKDEEIALKVDGDYYRKVGIHDEWRQVDFDNKKATYFSYQEKAAKDFIYRFNKCGILSDQVGMGKTIEAGMIITELAYRKELGSLLILVPNENMAEKWEIELARKFGFRNYYKDLTMIEGNEEEIIKYENLPKVASVKSVNDVYALIYTAYDEIHNKVEKTFDYKLKATVDKVYDEICDEKYETKVRRTVKRFVDTYATLNSKEFKMAVLKEIYAPLIKEIVQETCKSLGYEKEYDEAQYEMSITGNYYHIVDMTLDSLMQKNLIEITITEKLLDKEVIVNSILDEFVFLKAPLGKDVLEKINKGSKKVTKEKDRLSYVQEFRDIATRIRQKYAILIFSKIVAEGENTQVNILNYCLNEVFESESTRHCAVNSQVERGYFVIDLLIDMAYRTLIVDEAHDYIKVSHKLRMRDDIAKITDYTRRQREGIEFSDIDLTANDIGLKYYVFPLYNDYYFVNKDCLYLKVKALAERSYRKIFMTATPIKSDMIDFYLLYLLADNSDVNTSNRIRKMLHASGYDISDIAGLLMVNMTDSQKRAMNYCTHEDLVIKYVYKFYNNYQDKLTGDFNNKIKQIIVSIVEDKIVNQEVIKDICVNTVRKQFQETFTIKDEATGKDMEISSISDLVSSDEGIEHWQNMYSQIGIRSTRHQTFKLDEEHLNLINPVQRDKYRNLPTWSRRNGTIVYIHKKDNYFDLIVKNKLEEKKAKRDAIPDTEEQELREKLILNPKNREIEKATLEYKNKVSDIQDEDISDKAKESKEKKEKALLDLKVQKIEKNFAPKETAMDIYNYINEQLSGKLSIADYYSTDVDYDDFKLHMVAKLMTDGLELQDENKVKKIEGKVLLFTDDSTQMKVLNWLKDEVNPNNTMSQAQIDEYYSKYKHHPIWYYNQSKANEEERWVITTDIKALKEKKGNYLIVVEPNKYEEGVDLQTSNVLINFDIKFCPLKMEQRIGRIDRVKLCDEQPQLDIISFTPLNDMSGFMVDFLANDLKMFSCWKGDTTGIVSMPLGEKPNSATFENAILAINEAYKGLYNYNGKDFIKACSNINEMAKNFTSGDFSEIENIVKEDNKVLDDFKYLIDNEDIINKVVLNSKKYGNDKEIAFGNMNVVIEQSVRDAGKISNEKLTKHKNDIEELRKAIEEYYSKNMEMVSQQMLNIEKAYNKTSEGGTIENSNGLEQERYNNLQNKYRTFDYELKKYQESELIGLEQNSVISAISLNKIINPILRRYKDLIDKYLDVLLNLFDKFCVEVSDRAKKMTKFISYLTIEEFRVMAGNYE